jgi:hypothetical protein
MAVTMNALGEAGVSRFGILIGFLIPIINVLAVSTLIWYSGQTIDIASGCVSPCAPWFPTP